MAIDTSNRAEFFPDYRSRTAGSIHEYNFAQKSEKISLSATDSPTEEAKSPTFLSFIKSAVDIINPLHHLPIVSSIYRKISGDEINTAAKVAGSTLYGGALGGILSFATSALDYSQENSSKTTLNTHNIDNISPIKSPIIDLERTNYAIKNYMDAGTINSKNSTNVFSIEK